MKILAAKWRKSVAIMKRKQLALETAEMKIESSLAGGEEVMKMKG
jgi:hypothetical protein